MGVSTPAVSPEHVGGLLREKRQEAQTRSPSILSLMHIRRGPAAPLYSRTYTNGIHRLRHLVFRAAIHDKLGGAAATFAVDVEDLVGLQASCHGQPDVR